jgi:hypothetical protein
LPPPSYTVQRQHLPNTVKHDAYLVNSLQFTPSFNHPNEPGTTLHLNVPTTPATFRPSSALTERFSANTPIIQYDFSTSSAITTVSRANFFVEIPSTRSITSKCHPELAGFFTMLADTLGGICMDGGLHKGKFGCTERQKKGSGLDENQYPARSTAMNHPQLKRASETTCWRKHTHQVQWL